MPVFKRSFFILLFLAAVALGVTVYTLPEGPEAKPLDAATAPVETAVVHVSGAVRKPGVVRLSAGDRVEQAVAACGGALPTADMDQVNLAQTVRDGAHIRVPEKVSAAEPKGAAAAMEAEDDRVPINTADEKALEALPGIGPVMAKRIVDYRNQHGAFQDAADLKRVRGIGDATYEKLKDRVRL